MSDDLVRRLKAIEVQPIDQFGRWLTNIRAEAAAEIERLRMAEVERAAALVRIARLEAVLAERDDVLMDVLASLIAAVSLLKRGSKKAAPSDRMFDQMIIDYERSIERARGRAGEKA